MREKHALDEIRGGRWIGAPSLRPRFELDLPLLLPPLCHSLEIQRRGGGRRRACSLRREYFPCARPKGQSQRASGKWGDVTDGRGEGGRQQLCLKAREQYREKEEREREKNLGHRRRSS